jgi:hypothetical protein
MNGQFGVFDRLFLLAEFGDDESADEYRRELLQEEIPDHLRNSAYDPDDLSVREIPVNYDLWLRLLYGLKASRRQDVSETARSGQA